MRDLLRLVYSLPPTYDKFKTFVEKSLREYYLETHQCTDDPLDVPFEVDEVIKVVQHLPSGKADDKITYEHLKYGGSCLIDFIVNISNVIRVEEHVAKSWTVGSITSILKGGKKNKLYKANYRGITLLSVLGKVFERLFLDRWIPVCISK